MAEALGYKNASKALADHVEECDKLNNELLSSFGQRGGWLINESGLYDLIFGSKLESAKRFKHWVTSTNKIGGEDSRASQPTIKKQSYIMGLQRVLEVKFSPLFIAYKSYTQRTRSGIRGI